MDSQTDKTRKEIEQTRASWKGAITASDPDAIGNLATWDAVFWTHDSPELNGREALKESFDTFFGQYRLCSIFSWPDSSSRETTPLSGEPRSIGWKRLTAATNGLRQRAFSMLRRGTDDVWRFSRGMTNLPPEGE